MWYQPSSWWNNQQIIHSLPFFCCIICMLIQFWICFPVGSIFSTYIQAINWCQYKTNHFNYIFPLNIQVHCLDLLASVSYNSAISAQSNKRFNGLMLTTTVIILSGYWVHISSSQVFKLYNIMNTSHLRFDLNFDLDSWDFSDVCPSYDVSWWHDILCNKLLLKPYYKWY